MVDAADSKSAVRKDVRVRVSPEAPIEFQITTFTEGEISLRFFVQAMSLSKRRLSDWRSGPDGLTKKTTDLQLSELEANEMEGNLAPVIKYLYKKFKVI